MTTIPINNILRDANTLRQTVSQKRQIDEAVREVLSHLNTVITQEHELGNGHVKYKLPMQFDIDGMTFSKMQQNVWCRIIIALEEKNYKVKIYPAETECILYVKWESDDEKIETANQLKILADHSKR
jgi:Ni,Fe-hydrogenase III component G